ncbi:hypothetical protein MRX96_005987 [Rhipicephalus microplus]
MASAENTVFCPPFPVQPPTSFNFDKVSEWPAWVQDFHDYLFASGLSKQTVEAQVCTLMYTMGQHARNIFRIFELSEKQSKDNEVVKKRFDAYFVATRNSVYERQERKKRYNNNNMIFTAVRTTKKPALRSTQFIEKLAGGQSTNGSTKTSESVWRVAEPVIGSHRILQKEQSAMGAKDGDTSLQCAHKGRTSRMPK